MKNKNLVIFLTILITLVCSYFLAFTWISNDIQDEATLAATDQEGKIDFAKRQMYLDSLWNGPAFNLLGAQYSLKEIRDQEIHLGLDLQGGMHVIMEVSPVDIVRNLAGTYNKQSLEKAITLALEKQKSSQEKFVNLFYQSFQETNPGVTLATVFSNASNKGKISYNSSDKEVLSLLDKEIEGAIDRSFNILRTRIDKFGVANPNIQRLKGTGRIQLELPGVDNPQRVRKLLQGTAKLEFLEVYEADQFGPYLDQINKLLVKMESEGNGLTTETKTDSLAKPLTTTEGANDLFAGAKDSSGKKTAEVKDTTASKKQSSLLAKLFVPLGGGLGSNVIDTPKVNKLFARPEIRAILPSNMKFLWDIKPIVADDKQEYVALYAVKKGRDGKAPLTGEAITDARSDFDQNGKPEVTMSMSSSGAKKWRRITADNIGKRIAIVLDDYVYSAPTVQNEIPNGNSSISGNFTIDDTKDLENILKAGKLPAPTKIVEEAIIGPSLGKEAIQQGLVSCLIGLGAVILFMMIYYSGGGLIADIALCVNLFFIMGLLAQVQAVLTLPGIAGIVLTIGMAVDANVLIYERIREELNAGKSLLQAIEMGYSKANSSIVDGNVTTFLVGVILFMYGSGPVQGFAVTLMLGIATSFFTSVYISRLVVEWWAKRPGASAIGFSTRMTNGLFKNIQYDIIGNRKKAYIFSSVLIVVGFACIFAQGGLNLGVDFKGGRSYVVKFDNAVPASEVKEKLAGAFQNAGTEVKTFGANTQLKITTSYLTEVESEQGDSQVLKALMLGLDQYKDQHPAVLSSSKVGATIADDIKQTSLLSIVLSLAGIFLYIFIRFKNFSFSLGAIIALAHDVLMVIAVTGIFSIFGLNYEIDQIYIAAVLTIIGYSINDTVVVFDRIREILATGNKSDLAGSINEAILNTFSRTIITAFTVFLVVVVLFFFGGEVLKGFSFALIIGVVFGSYSSIFIASPIVLDLATSEKESQKEIVKV